jgi:hypothetical protein
MFVRHLIPFEGVLLALAALFWLHPTAVEAASVEVPRISVEQANQLLNGPDVNFIDVRSPKSWWRSTAKIAHAIREEPDAVKQWAAKYTRDKTLIFYCT